MSDKKMIHGFVTKWALTVGIVDMDGHLYAGSGDTVYFTNSGHIGRKRQVFVRWGKDAFPTLEEAIADAKKRAEDGVKKARKALDKALARLTAYKDGQGFPLLRE